MNRKAWQGKHQREMTIYQWIALIPGTIFLITAHRPFWQELLGLLVINGVLHRGGTYLAWFFAPDGRKAQRGNTNSR